MQPAVSIVIVNYNVKDFLHKCLESIDKSVFNRGEVETIVVDNDSSDGSVEYLRPLFPKVKFSETGENLGFGKANNLGFEIATGKYILILNPDTVIEENNLQTMYDYMEDNPEVGIAGCKVLNPDGTFQLPCRRGFPTPWASFSKLFGLQSLFPKSKLFAQYNQTFRSEDETYEIDAIMGAYMFARADVIEKLGGFDRDFFMYGEDIDLCFRNKKLGYETRYVHTTSIIHYKGESTRRSSINDVKHFYDAMAIFAEKHYARSKIFLLFLKTGIFLRAGLAYLGRIKSDLLFILVDLLIINAALLVSTKIRFGEFFAFPDLAYPTVFIAVSSVLLFSMTVAGEYFEGRHSFRKSIFGVLIMFFITSSLTYFFKQFAFSRGIVLMMTGFSGLLMPGTRLLSFLLRRAIGTEKEKKILVVGLNPEAAEIVHEMESPEHSGVKPEGFVSIDESYPETYENYPVLGNIFFLDEIIKKAGAKEVIIAEPKISNNKLMEIVSKFSSEKIRYHIAGEYDQFLYSEIIEDITGRKSPRTAYPIDTLRNKIFKRFADMFMSLILLTAFLPLTAAVGKKPAIQKLFEVFLGKKSIFGLYVRPGLPYSYPIGKEGITGLAHIANPERLSDEAINKLNEYYLSNYSVSLDMDILVKKLFRK